MRGLAESISSDGSDAPLWRKGPTSEGEDLVDHELLRYSLHPCPVRPGLDEAAQVGPRLLTEQKSRLELLVQALQAGGDVDRLTDSRIGDPIFAAQVAYNGGTRVDADADPQRCCQ